MHADLCIVLLLVSHVILQTHSFNKRSLNDSHVQYENENCYGQARSIPVRQQDNQSISGAAQKQTERSRVWVGPGRAGKVGRTDMFCVNTATYCVWPRSDGCLTEWLRRRYMHHGRPSVDLIDKQQCCNIRNCSGNDRYFMCCMLL